MTRKPQSKSVQRATTATWLLCVVAAAIVARPYLLKQINDAFMSAVRAGRTYEVERLLTIGADPNGDRATRSNPFVLSPLSVAVQQSHVAVARTLLSHGAQVNARSIEEAPPLVLAAQIDSEDEVRLLLDHGAAVNAADAGGNTALIVGAPNPSLIELLIAKGALVDVANAYSQTALGRAAGALSVESVRLLLRHGADIDHRTVRGVTPLHRAIRSAPTLSPELAPRWPGLRSYMGKPLLSPASLRRGGIEEAIMITRLLLNAGAEVNTESIDGYSPLMEAASRPPQLAAMLLAHGADPNYSNIRQETVLSTAVANRNAAVTWVLTRSGATR